ncbi:MAG: glutamate/tyrosine decarboxylase-like PLP-dependent enzyme [Phenylobacterium sp.]|jgi:glutamate/tyrosine decarboxylase-like PLP-dependent enzyme
MLVGKTPYDCGIFLTRRRQYLFDSCDVPAPYLVSSGDEPDFMSLGIENSRRFRALPVWLSLLVYGRVGITGWIKRNVDMAKRLADWLEQSEGYELVYPCQLNVVLFRPKASDLAAAEHDALTTQTLANINRDGRLFLSPGVWQGKKIIRAALSNWQTDDQDIEIAQAALADVAEHKFVAK